MEIVMVVGTRPHVAKVFALRRALLARGASVALLHTHQHHDPGMHADLFAELGYAPDATLVDYRLGAAIDWVHDELVRRRADVVVVQGDSAPALVGAVAAEYADVRIAHVEAGLRSGDDRMREEVNRIAVDGMAHELFAYCPGHAEHLAAMPHLRGSIHVVGNPTVDLVRLLGDRVRPTPGFRYLVTLHRRELTEDPACLAAVLGSIGEAALKSGAAVTFAVHPRTRAVLDRHGIDAARLLGPDSEVVPPVGLVEALSRITGAAVVVTDSGCVQEEACILGTPCVTVRESTERPETIDVGANVVCGMAPEDIAAAVLAAEAPRSWTHPYGDGHAADRIADVLLAG